MIPAFSPVFELLFECVFRPNGIACFVERLKVVQASRTKKVGKVLLDNNLGI